MNLALLLPLLFSAAQEPPGAVDQQPVDYQRQVRPILAKRCLACHGGDESTREAELQLQLRDDATRLRDDEYRVIEPGNAEASELIFRVQDNLDPMPPKKTGHKLTAEEIEVLTRWINEGAEYTPHWAFQKPQKAQPPALPVGMRGKDVSAIDAFIYERLAAEGLSPAPRADRRTLIRRLSLDLIGLPPTPEEVEAFVNDLKPGAYERLVDRLLASPHFGERWASVWLDLARYADSKGHGSDPLRSIYRYRDWVIEAINADMRFDEFTLQQMAGDMLPDATTDHKLATAFHRNSLVNTEGGTDDEEFRVAAVKDRINLSMQVWMGMTFGCAECHTHKFDPITHEDYYSTFAIFNQTADTDKNDDSPKIDTPTAGQHNQLRMWRSEQDELRRQIAEVPVDENAFDHWRIAERNMQDAWKPAVPLIWRKEDRIVGNYVATSSGSIALKGIAADKDSLSVVTPNIQGTPTALKLRTLTNDSLPRRGPGASPDNGNFVLSEVRLYWHPGQEIQYTREGEILGIDPAKVPQAQYVRVNLPGEKRILSLAEVEVFRDGKNIAGSGSASQSSTDYEGVAERAIDGETDGNYFGNSVTHCAIQDAPWWELDLGSAQPIERVQIWNRTDGNLQPRLSGAVIELLDGNRGLVASYYLVIGPLETEQWLTQEKSQLRVSHIAADFEQNDYTAAMAIDGNPQTGWAIAPQQGQDHELHLHFDCPQGDGVLEVVIDQNYGGKHVLGHFDLSWTDLPVPPTLLPNDVKHALFAELGGGSAREAQAEAHNQTVLRDYFRDLDPGIQGLREELVAIDREIKELKVSKTPVLVALPADKHRQTFVLDKGNFLLPMQEVHADVPAAFEWGDGAINDRRKFAEWLTHSDNPLTPRVQANRIWARLFGRGLVSTEEDFGAQGALPSHEQLLDWLAVEYASHWSLKQFLTTLVTSSTYRQSSRTLAVHLEKDPDNILLSRGPRFRLPAETVRDQALLVSGLLSRKIGGPSVFPPQPDGLWQAAFNGERDWRTSQGEDRWRRGVYTFLRRSTPYPSMVVFDAPSREICTIRRIRTNTPLQAFVTLNDPVFVECAQALARRMLDLKFNISTSADADVARLRQAYRWCTAKPADDAVIEVLQELLAEQRAHYQQNHADAVVMATDPLGPLPEAADATEYAAWTVVANVLLNMDEFLNKN